MAKRITRTSLTDDQIRKEGGEIKRQDPISRMPMVVSVLDIVAYEKNPRKHTNESYAEIKESIRLKGLEQPFTITRRPGVDKYTTKAGGNTRLQILQELYSETGDEKFLKVHLVFEPWVSEADTLISHLTENDLRGNLILIDRAQGVREAQTFLEEERGLNLSTRELSAALAEQGYSIGKTALNTLIYAIDRLYPFMPEALDAGMGKPAVEKIRKFENRCKEAWTEMAKDPALMDTAFETSLRQADAAEWYFDDLVKIFIENAAEQTNEKISLVEFYIHRAMNAKKPPTKAELEAFNQSQVDGAAKPTSESESEVLPIEETNQPTPEKINIDHDFSESSDEDDETSDVPFASDLDEEHVDDDSDSNVKTEVESELPEERYSLNDLRAKAIDLACSVAKYAHIEDLVIKVDDGFGWILADIPQHIHFPNGFVDTDPDFQKIWSTWFGLFQVSGCSDREFSQAIATHIPEEKNDLRFLLTGEWDKLREHGQYISTAAVQTDYFLSTSNEALEATFQLIKVHRDIKRLSQALVKPLWTGA
ncbi:ParB family protein [Thiomicrospira sp.]|uniref:ParB family protein n=1 Tax=Thiomicrospira sp. TaxID=935 RepID=UPI002F95A970